MYHLVAQNIHPNNSNIRDTTELPSVSKISVSDNTVHSQHIYIDCVLFNPSFTTVQPIVFDQSRLNQIVNKTSDYKIGVKSINGRLFASFFNLQNYFNEITMTFPANNISESVVLPQTNTQINSVEQFLTYVNNALIQCFANVILAYDAIFGAGSWVANTNLPQFAPWIIYDADTQLFSIYNDLRSVETDANRVNLFFNYSLYEFFAGLEYIPGTNNVRLIFNRMLGGFNEEVLDYTTGVSGTFVYSRQDTPSLGTWNTVSTLVITSNALSCRKEQLLINRFDSISTATISNVITTFPINKTTTYEQYIHFDTPQITYIDLYDDAPLTHIQFELFFLRNDGSTERLNIAPRSSVLVKFILTKSLFTN
jgi:hypothetical protein